MPKIFFGPVHTPRFSLEPLEPSRKERKMRLVATINGTDVYSDKDMIGVNNSRIDFSDGSWCDVATGQVVNNGPGSISIGGTGQKSEKQITVGPKSYQASMLDVRDIEADVEINPSNGSEIVVTISGKQSAVEGVLVSLRGGNLVVSGKVGGSRTGGADVFISGGSISIGGMRGVNIVAGNSVVIGSGSKTSDVKVLIEVPVHSAVQVAGVQGSVKVGDTDGPFSGSVLGSTGMRIGKVRDAQLLVQGSGDVKVTEVNGTLSMTIQGSGDITISRGDVRTLAISVTGSGDATFGGTATDANLSVIGSGDIDVKYVKNQPVSRKMGSGDIEVGNW